MENAAKALLIAAGMFIAVILVTFLVDAYGQVSEYYANKHEYAELEQVEKFNSRFENYNRENIRGTDLISLMNRVIDYNATESYFEDKRYERIKVTIKLGDDNIIKQFTYDDEDIRNTYLKEKITNTNVTGSAWNNDKQLIDITNTPSDLCGYAYSKEIKNVTDTKLKKLSSNISNIIVSEDGESKMDAYNRFLRADVIEKVLGIEVCSHNGSCKCDSPRIKIDEETGITKSGTELINVIKEIASQYYQYTQYKSAYFDCTEIKYDTRTNRVIEMNFELKIENNLVVFSE